MDSSETKQSIEAAAVERAATEAGEVDLVSVAKKAADPTGLAGGGSLQNLLPQYLAGLRIDGLSETEGTLSFERALLGGDKKNQLIFEVNFALDTEVFPALAAKLQDALPDFDSTGLQKRIGDFDQADVAISYSRDDREGTYRMGRDPRDYFKIYQHLYLDAVAGTAAQGYPTLHDALKEHPAIRAHPAARASWPRNWTSKLPLSTLIEELGEENAAELAVITAVAATGASDSVKALDERWHGVREHLDDLIASQPQLIANATYKLRDELTGPNELTASIRYEQSLGRSLNDFLKWGAESDDGARNCSSDPETKATVDCLESYLKHVELSGSEHKADRGIRDHRLAITARYTDADDYSFSLPDQDFEFSLDATEKWTAQLAYGFYLPNFQLLRDQGEDGSRLSLEYQYDDVTGDPERQNRQVARLTLTQKLTEKASASIGAVWANRPEYRGAVEEELSARLGLTWSGLPGLSEG